MTYWYNSLKVWISIDQEIRSKDNCKYLFQKYAQMVNTINHKYFRINSKTESRNFYKDKWTLINNFSNEKGNPKVYRQWIYFDRMTDEKLGSWFWANIEGLKYITNNAIIKNSESKSNRVNSAEQKFH